MQCMLLYSILSANIAWISLSRGFYVIAALERAIFVPCFSPTRRFNVLDNKWQNHNINALNSLFTLHFHQILKIFINKIYSHNNFQQTSAKKLPDLISFSYSNLDLILVKNLVLNLPPFLDNESLGRFSHKKTG